MFAETVSQELLIHGTILFLFGLLNGLAIPAFRNRRMGLSAHMAGVQNGIVLWAFGLMWAQVELEAFAQSLAAWAAIFGMYTIWLGLFMAAIWGTSRITPIAGKGFAGTPGKEAIVTALIVAGSLAIIVAVAMVLYGLL